ncbi:hypothetical protein D3C79_891500 [compost metagenome]
MEGATMGDGQVQLGRAQQRHGIGAVLAAAVGDHQAVVGQACQASGGLDQAFAEHAHGVLVVVAQVRGEPGQQRGVVVFGTCGVVHAGCVSRR